jgi:hypothetical protein
MKMRSVEAEQRTKSRKAIVLDPGNPSVTKQLAHAEGSPWRMSNKQKKEPPPKKRKVDPPPGIYKQTLQRACGNTLGFQILLDAIYIPLLFF